MNGIIDFHTHAFPDEIAERAMKSLEEGGGIKPSLDGRISSLLGSMDRNGIEKSIVCSIATKPSQFDSILSWCKKIRTERIIPFPSLHPDDPALIEKVAIIKGEGFKGIKLHPYYQDFDIDDRRLFPFYEKVVNENLLILMHTGFDFAFERIRRADPEKILTVMENFPSLKMVTSHLGAWGDWDEVERLLAGKKIYMEISYALDLLSPERARDIIMSHPSEYVLFGTDSPWTGQDNTLALLKRLQLDEKLEKAILRDNAMRLLPSV